MGHDLDRIRCPKCMHYLTGVVTRELRVENVLPSHTVHLLGGTAIEVKPVMKLEVLGECVVHGLVRRRA